MCNTADLVVNVKLFRFLHVHFTYTFHLHWVFDSFESVLKLDIEIVVSLQIVLFVLEIKRKAADEKARSTDA